MSSATHDEYYYVAAVKGNFPWPSSPVRLRYGDHWFQLIPPAADRYANVVLELPRSVPRGADVTEQDRHATIMHRFLSALSWAEDAALEAHGSAGGSRPFPVVGTRYAHTTAGAVPKGIWLPQTQDRNALRALGLVKEARAIQASYPAIAFLWLYKAIEVCVGHKGKGPERFYKSVTQKLSGRAKAVLDALQLQKPLEKHMRETRRHSIAHGEYAGSVDPDDMAFKRKIRDELPLIEELAELAIEERFGILHPTKMMAGAQAGGSDEGWTAVVLLEENDSRATPGV